MILKYILNLFYPKKCIFCGEPLKDEKEFYCRKCYYKLPILSEDRCLICGRELYSSVGYKICPTCQKHKMYIDVNYPAFIYEGNIKSALKRFKFAGRMWYYKQFAALMYANLKDKNIKADYIVYPPISKKTFYKRGYNQSELISEELSRLLKIKLLRNPILKIRDNEKQSLMPASKRFENVRDVFYINEKYNNLINGKRVLLIDDVLTTGATLSACSKELKKSGAKFVYSSTLCITR